MEGFLLAMNAVTAIPVPVSCGFLTITVLSMFKATAEAAEQRLWE